MKKTALAAALLLCAQWASADSETSEIITLKLDVAGEMETLDMENFPVGATETIYAESGRQALVPRFEDRFEVEISGEQIVVDLPQLHALEIGDHHTWISTDEDIVVNSEAEKHVFIKKISSDDVSDIDLANILAEHGIDPDAVHEAHEKHVVIHSASGDDISDLDLTELLAEHGIDSSEMHEAHEKKVVIIKSRSE